MRMHMHMHTSQAPEMRPIKLTGIVSNHPVLADGPISTSLIQMIDEARGLAWTIR